MADTNNTQSGGETTSGGAVNTGARSLNNASQYLRLNYEPQEGYFQTVTTKTFFTKPLSAGDAEDPMDLINLRKAEELMSHIETHTEIINRNIKEVPVVSGSGTQTVTELAWEYSDYINLPLSQKNNGKFYFIYED